MTLLVSACFVDTQSLNTSQAIAFSHIQDDPWRRTAQGWEKKGDWSLHDGNDPIAASIHPGLLASFQLLACVGGLLAMEPNRSVETATGLQAV